MFPSDMLSIALGLVWLITAPILPLWVKRPAKPSR